MLFMPGDDLKKITRGAGLGVDCIIMDIEDGVAASRKGEARQIIKAALTSGQINFGRTERWVRINPASTGFQDTDLKETFCGAVDGYIIPKVESPEEILAVASALRTLPIDENAPQNATKLIALIETARGVVNLREIAQADPSLVGLGFGAEDLAGSLGAIRTSGGHEVAYARSAVVMHAAAFSLQALDTPFTALSDPAGLAADTLSAIQMGYTGKMAIHPAQIAPIIDAFTPTPAELDHARRLIEAYGAHQSSGAGVFTYEGRMIDMPMIRTARRVIARAAASGL
jgi:citrate lyase beta subunit